jgi:chromosome segregation ATPase
MNRLARVLAIALTLAFSLSAVCAQQLQRVQSALDALQQSAAALEQNDPAKAVTVLAGMKSTIGALRGDVVDFRDHAGAAAKKREAELLEVNRRYTLAHQAEEQANETIRRYPDELKQLRPQLDKLERENKDLARQKVDLDRRVGYREKCKKHWTKPCAYQDLSDAIFGVLSRLNSDVERNNRELAAAKSRLIPLSQVSLDVGASC